MPTTQIKLPGGERLAVSLPSERKIEADTAAAHLKELRKRLTSGRDALDRQHTIKASTLRRRKSGSTRAFVNTGRLVRGLSQRGGEVTVSVDRLEAASKLEDMGRPVVAVLEEVMEKELQRVMDASLR